ncbi:MAG: CBS domain-containing protein [Gammaproteobacteria bacterium]|nr:MAG: CBS domain-containing protein [Gammaproteobacteria bacterium]
MKTVADIMTRNVISLKESDNLHQARQMMKEYNIRHIPILTDDGKNYAGLLRQRDILNNAFNIVEKYGLGKLAQREERTPIKEMMSRDCATVASTTPLKEAGEFFVTNKHGCLPVVDNEELVGIISSVDFVKLALHLL